ncbi:MAG: shikimate dehydrogenase [Desulfobacterales bacterium]|nr:MAG: shikimate dehydrogenase [Desulfobacterales bacterium]
MPSKVPTSDMGAKTASALAEWRRRIDEIDETILTLINRRLAFVQEIGKLKKQIRKPVVDDTRESEVLARLARLNADGRLPPPALRRIFGDIIAASREIQAPPSATPPGAAMPKIYVVLGNPVAHSLSPVMHNRAFGHVGHNGIYLACRVEDLAPALAGIRALDISGASITIPHKVAALDWLDEVDAAARQIGAVNTVVNRQGVLCGYNSDCAGAIRALSAKTSIKSKRVAIIGAGGAARAIGFGIIAEGGLVTIINRTPAKGEQLARDLGAEFRPLADADRVDCDILINTTPVGMLPETAAMPLPPEALSKEMIVMDAIYNPLMTRLLREAAQRGCTTVDGVAMFVYQGAIQFELWTGRAAPVEIMRATVLEALASANLNAPAPQTQGSGNYA